MTRTSSGFGATGSAKGGAGGSAAKRKTLFSIVMAGALALGAAFVLLASPTTSFAASSAIEAAKRNCIVGERNDGYLGVVNEGRANDSLRREVASVNQRRKAAYTRLARQNGVSIRDTGVLTAEKLIRRAPSGQCVQNANGAWIKKR
ncbi:MAG: YdbL family protein [Pseudomonadota bacterium]